MEKLFQKQDMIICSIVMALLAVCCAPLLMAARYCYPVADDFVYGLRTHCVVARGGRSAKSFGKLQN